MKRSLFTLGLIFMVINMMAYEPIVVEGYKWNVVNRNVSLDANNTIVYSTHVEMFEGDSVVDVRMRLEGTRSMPFSCLK